MAFPVFEELVWRLARRPSEAIAVLGITSALGLLAGGATALGRVVLPRPIAIGVVLIPGAVLSADRILHYRYLTEPAAILMALGVSLVAATLLGRIAVWPLGLPTMALVFSAPLALAVVVSPRESVTAPGGGVKNLPDVVLLVMDTTRRDHLSLYGYPRPTSPCLDAAARDAQVYEDAWSVAPWTPPSHASMLTGLLPAQHGVDGQATPPFPRGLLTLPAILRRAGYRTGGFVANPGLAEKGWAGEFDVYRVPWHQGRHSLVLLLNRWREGSADPWRTAFSTKRTLGLARDWWQKSAGHPRFAFINLLDPHRPYDPPPEERRNFLGDADPKEVRTADQDPITYHLKPGVSARQAEILRGLYDAEIAAMDREIGAFLDWLRARGDLDRTILLVTADHGERLGERGLLGHELMMDPHLLRVPLVIRYPQALRPARVVRRVQLDGIPGYLLHLAGIPAPTAMRDGALDRQDRRIVVAQRQDPAWFVGKILRRHPNFDGKPHAGDWFFAADLHFAYTCSHTNQTSPLCVLNDLLADPEWTRDAREEHPEAFEALKRAGLSLPAFPVIVPQKADPEILERLKALGYVD